MTKTIMILVIAVALVAGTISTATFVSAAPPENNPGKPFDAILQKLDEIIATLTGTDTEVTNIEAKLDDPNTGLAAIKTAVDGISTGGIPASTQTQIDNIESDVGMIKTTVGGIDTEVTNIEAKLDNPNFGLEEIKKEVTTIESNQFVPFAELIEPQEDGFTCATAAQGFDSDQLRIGNTATSGNFVVTSILMFPTGVDEPQDIIRIASVRIRNDATTNPLFPTFTQDLTGLVGPSLRAFDIMGVTLEENGNFPTQITTAGSAFAFDIGITIFCNVGTMTDISFVAIQVSGWKQVGDTINLTYSETVI